MPVGKKTGVSLTLYPIYIYTVFQHTFVLMHLNISVLKAYSLLQDLLNIFFYQDSLVEC